MSDGFWQGFFGMLVALVPYLWKQLRDERRQRAIDKTKADAYMAAIMAETAKRVNASAAEIKRVVDERVRVTDAQIDLIKTGAFRMGHVAGQQEERKRQTNFGGLGGK